MRHRSLTVQLATLRLDVELGGDRHAEFTLQGLGFRNSLKTWLTQAGWLSWPSARPAEQCGTRGEHRAVRV